jgi:Tfp pilus assembly protein PilZ
VSAGGILFLTESTIEVGASISLDLHLPSLDAERTITLHAEGTVSRVEPAGANNKVAAEIRFDGDPEDGFAVTHTIQ